MCCMRHEDGTVCADAPARALELLRTARGTRAQLSSMIMPRHADAETREVVSGLLDQAGTA